VCCRERDSDGLALSAVDLAVPKLPPRGQLIVEPLMQCGQDMSL